MEKKTIETETDLGGIALGIRSWYSLNLSRNRDVGGQSVSRDDCEYETKMDNFPHRFLSYQGLELNKSLIPTTLIRGFEDMKKPVLISSL